MPNKATIRQARYDSKNATQIALKLNLKTDKDILDAVGSVNKQGTIKSLIRSALSRKVYIVVKDGNVLPRGFNTLLEAKSFVGDSTDCLIQEITI